MPTPHVREITAEEYHALRKAHEAQRQRVQASLLEQHPDVYPKRNLECHSSSPIDGGSSHQDASKL